MAVRWRRNSQRPKTQFESIFDDRVSNIYGGMLEAAREKKNDAGVITRPARHVPFTQFEFAGWVLIQLRNDRAGAVQCAYCSTWLNIDTLTIDHRIPKSPPWNGSLGLENLTCACQQCNSAKGGMSEAGFRAYIAWAIENLDPRDMRNQIGRMANGGGFRPLQGRYNALAQKMRDREGKPLATPAQRSLL